MSATLIADIGELVTCDGTGPDALGRLADAALVVEAGRIAWIGPADRAPGCDRRVTVDGRAVIPGFVDSHTHLAFAGDRAAEFAARMAGASYDGGGSRQRSPRPERRATHSCGNTSPIGSRRWPPKGPRRSRSSPGTD